MLRNLSLTLIAVAVLSACGSSGGGLGTSLAGAKSLAGANQTDSGAGNADDGASGDSGAALVAPNKNNTNNQKPNPTPTPTPTPTPQDPAPSKLIPFSEVKQFSAGRYLQELTIDGKTYRYRDKETSVDDDTMNLAELGMGLSTRQVEYSVTPTVDSYSINLDPSKKDTAKGILTVYQRPYSTVYSSMLPGVDIYTADYFFKRGCETDATAASCKLDDSLIKTFGYRTSRDVLNDFANNNQKFSYSGEAFTVAPVPERGVFKYQINFGIGNYGLPDATSSGSITGFNSVGDITLSSDRYGNSIQGTATESKNGRIGSYTLDFFGPNAEEIAGGGIFYNTGKDANGISTNTIFGFSGAR